MALERDDLLDARRAVGPADRRLEQARHELDPVRVGVAVLVDPFSANYLRGSVIDFSDALTGGGFKISNPNARQSCGCGKSFEA